MILINFAHPLTDMQKRQLENLLGVSIKRVIEANPQFDPQQGFEMQTEMLINAVGLTSTEWQTTPLSVILPSLSAIAVTLMAELHGRCGYFLPMVRIRPKADALPPVYEVAELLNLQALRDRARSTR